MLQKQGPITAYSRVSTFMISWGR